MNKPRLLNLIKALQESPAPERFTMDDYVHPCGTPACVLGHYAARSDLQDFLTAPRDGWQEVQTTSGERVPYWDQLVLQHFDIAYSQACELFSTYGCGRAKTVDEAIAYLRRFIDVQEG